MPLFRRSKAPHAEPPAPPQRGLEVPGGGDPPAFEPPDGLPVFGDDEELARYVRVRNESLALCPPTRRSPGGQDPRRIAA
jgi:hypothetical protein